MWVHEHGQFYVSDIIFRIHSTWGISVLCKGNLGLNKIKQDLWGQKKVFGLYNKLLFLNTLTTTSAAPSTINRVLRKHSVLCSL